MKKRVTGIGGIFFKTNDPEQARQWYAKHLGIESESWGTSFTWRDAENPEQTGSTAWCLFPKDSQYFTHEFMVNYRVENLAELITQLKAEGVTIVSGPEESEFGKFAWILDHEGRKIELWEEGKG
jgi:predicted enzyme related to lactoylglutathione lyase